jgi:hypothetical protein
MTLFDGIVDDPTHLPTFVGESFIFAATGLILGVLVDKQFKKLKERFPKYKLLIAAIQIIFLVSVIAVFYKFAKHEFALHFQQTLPGMAFPAMYFGVQSNLFDTAQNMFV